MKIFNLKKGFVQHPAFMFIFALILGLVVAYVWINYINVPNPYCQVPKP